MREMLLFLAAPAAYTLTTEPGTSLRAAGWRVVGEVRGRSWDTPSRPRVDRHPTLDKLCWEVASA